MTKLTIIILIASTALSKGQSKKVPDVFENCYVVTLKNDTITGQLKLPKKKESELYAKINFKDKQNKVKVFTPEKIKGYYYKDYFYLSAYRDNKSCFFKILSKGKAQLMLVCYEHFDGVATEEINEYCVYTEGKEENLKVLNEEGLKKQLKDIFKTNKELTQKISEQKEISMKSETLQSYFNEFNATKNL